MAVREELYATPTWAVFAGQESPGAGTSGAALVTILQFLVALTDPESRTLAEKEIVPAAVGVPVMVPVEALRINPAGSDPVMENV